MKLLVSSNWLILEFESIVLCIFYECMDYCKFDDLFYVVMRTEGPPSIKMSLLFEVFWLEPLRKLVCAAGPIHWPTTLCYSRCLEAWSTRINCYYVGLPPSICIKLLYFIYLQF